MDNKLFKYIISKLLSFKVDVLILWESKMGYLDWRIGWLSGGIDEDFEQFDDELLRILNLSISESYIPLSSDQYIVFKISDDIKFRILWLNWRTFIKGGRIWSLNYVVALV